MKRRHRFLRLKAGAFAATQMCMAPIGVNPAADAPDA